MANQENFSQTTILLSTPHCTSDVTMKAIDFIEIPQSESTQMDETMFF